MSADNWARCPRCLQDAENALAAQGAEVDAAYGKVSVEEFDRMRDALYRAREHINGENAYRSFREDYEITGAENGEVEVTYSGECNKCGLKLKFNDSHPIPGVE